MTLLKIILSNEERGIMIIVGLLLIYVILDWRERRRK